MKPSQQINKFAIFLGLAVLTAMLLGGLGLYIYRKSGAYALDLSRPDYQKNRKDVKQMSEFDRLRVEKDGKVDQALVEQVDKSIEFYLNEVGSGAFTERAISDEALGLPTIESPEPPSQE